MTSIKLSRRALTAALISAPVLPAFAQSRGPSGRLARITDFGAKADDATINTRAIQAAIDSLAGQGGGTVVVPAGVFVSGALFLKPRVNLHLDKGAVIKCSTDVDANFPRQRTRIEGHFEEHFTPALINAKGCDGLRISGEGTFDGAGKPIWDEFWKRRNASRAGQPVPPDPRGGARARLALLEECKGLTVEGVTFKDSQFWNLHLYKCQDVLVRGVCFEVPDDYVQAPSTDGIDVDSCQRVTIDGCYFSVTDDCIALKGTKGINAREDKTSPPVEHIRVRNCHFRRGHHGLACGSEATFVRDVIVENSRVTGAMSLTMLKLRADTAQNYENIIFRNITLDSDGGEIMAIQPWPARVPDGAVPPQSLVRNVTFEKLTGRYGAFGQIKPNPGQTQFVGIVLKDIDLKLAKPKLSVEGTKDVRFDHVMVNGAAVTSI